jgi:hypothetical protein
MAVVSLSGVASGLTFSPAFAGVDHLFQELLAWHQGDVKANNRAVEPLALHQEVQKRAPDSTVLFSRCQQRRRQ